MGVDDNSDNDGTTINNQQRLGNEEEKIEEGQRQDDNHDFDFGSVVAPTTSHHPPDHHDLNIHGNTNPLVDTVVDPPTRNGVNHHETNPTTTTITATDPMAVNNSNSDSHHKQKQYVAANAPLKDRLWEVFETFWSLGFVAFGGPQAHIALLRTHLVTQRQWLDEDTFMELFAIGQGLPGPTSTQLVVSTATSRAGPLGGLLAFFLWQIPGLVVLTTCGILIEAFLDPRNPPWYLVGLPPAAISLVFKAFYGFATSLDRLGVILALCSCWAAILINDDQNIRPQSSQFVFPAVLALSGMVTYLDSKRTNPFSTAYHKSPSRGWDANNDETIRRIGIPMYMGALIFLVWLVVLITVILLIYVSDLHSKNLDIFETMYRIGSIIFGGGQVVLPLLQDEVVPQWMNKNTFLQGLALTQSLPGPLFNFSAYLGAVYHGVGGAIIGFLGLFGPGVLLIFAVIPFWARLRHNTTFRCILVGVNAAAIGLVGAACVILWETAILNAADAMVFCLGITLDVAFNVPAPLVVLAGGVLGAILHPDALNLGQKPYCIQQGFQYA